jgi:thiol-disulfide isomerase/thioredoxin
MLRKHLKGSNILFIVLLIIVLVPTTRYKVQAWIIQLMGSPEPMEEGIVISAAEMNFEYYNLKGDTFNLLDLRGKPLFINFWATWCGPCRVELPSIKRLVEKHQGDGQILLISNEDPALLNEFLGEDMADMPVYYSRFSPAFVNSNSIPLTYVIDSTGKVLIEKTGASDWDGESILNLLK